MADKIIATVAGREITEGEFEHFVTRIPADQQNFVKTPEGRRQALTQYCNYFLFEKYAEDMKYDESKEFQTILRNVRRELIGQYALTELVKDITASESECKAYYDEHADQFKKGPQAKAKHILTNTEEECLAAMKEIEDGVKTFEEAAKAYSTCPSGAQGGDLGTFGRGQMVKEFDEAVFTAETGKVLGPVQTQFGYHLIIVDQLDQGGLVPFETVADQISQKVIADKQNTLYMATRAELIEKYGLNFME